VSISYFITGFNRRDPAARLSEALRLELAEVLAVTARCERVEIGMPAEVQTYHGDAPVPALALRLDFAALPALEQELAPGGSLHRLASSPLWTALALDDVSQQAMVRRSFLDRTTGRGEQGCDYQVHYPGRAEDFNAWLRYYLGHHPQIMTRYPEVRAVDVFTRLDWCDSMPWRRVAYMQRNRLAFASAGHLLEALDSPVRQRMREDHERFPPYTEGSRHYPMLVTRLEPAAR